MDFAFLGGSMGSAVGEKFARACDLAIDLGVPLVSVTASGGARMQENILALMQMAKTTAGVDALQEAGLPYVSILAHPTTGGVMASFAALGDVILAEPNALMSFTGPRVVQQTTGETLPEDFGRAEANFRDGHVDQVVPRSELRATLSRLLGLLAGGVVELVEPEAEPERQRAVRRFFGRLRLRRHGKASSNGAAA
jgi:acetyl-CoA carboxylase carboxyl transferase subunit beta